MYEALAKAQADFKPIYRNKTVSVRMKSGGTYSFAYAPLETILEAVVPALNVNGFSITQDIVEDEKGREFVMTYLRHPTSPDPITSRARVIVLEDGPQAYGSATTYARRYGVTWLLCLSTDEDDDAGAAAGHETTVVKQVVVEDPLQDPANALADKFIAAAAAGLDEPIWEVHEAANHDSDLYRRAWSLIPSKDRSYIKKTIDKIKNGAAA